MRPFRNCLWAFLFVASAIGTPVHAQQVDTLKQLAAAGPRKKSATAVAPANSAAPAGKPPAKPPAKPGATVKKPTS